MNSSTNSSSAPQTSITIANTATGARRRKGSGAINSTEKTTPAVPASDSRLVSVLSEKREQHRGQPRVGGRLVAIEPGVRPCQHASQA